jgi:Transglycosylase SLT domain/Peptidase family M23
VESRLISARLRHRLIGLLRLFTAAAVVAAALATFLTVPASAQLQRVTVQLSDGTFEAITIDLPPGTTLSELQSGQVALAEPLPGTPVALDPIDEDQPPPASDPPPPPASDPPPPPASDPPPPPASDPPPPASDPPPPPAADPPPPASNPPLPPPAADPPQQDPPSSGTQPTPPADGSGTPSARQRPDEPRKRPDAKPTPDKGETTAKNPALRRPAPLRGADGTPTLENPGFVDAVPGPSTSISVPNFIIRKFTVPIFLLPIYQAAGIEYGVRWEVLAAINEIETDYGRNLNVSTAGAVGWMQFLPSTWKTWGVDANGDGKKDPYNPVDAIFSAARYLKAAGADQDIKRAIFAYNHAGWYVDSVLLRARLIAGLPADVVGSLTGLTEGRFPIYAHARYADDLAERNAGQPGTDIFARTGAPVVAVQDAVVKRIGRSSSLGGYVVLQDAYGNRYTYAQLGAVALYYPAPKHPPLDGQSFTEARGPSGPDDPRPAQPASAGRQDRQTVPRRARERGGSETYSVHSSRPFGLGSSAAQLRPLKRGAQVVAGTVIGRIGGSVRGIAPHLHFEIRPAGSGAPLIDPKPILDGWKLLEATAVYRANGENVLRAGATSLGQMLLMPKQTLERRVLGDPRLEIYPAGREDIRSGQINWRVLAVLEYLAERGLRPTVSSLKSGHGLFTASGNVSEHASGNAVDISAINGIPIAGHQEPGGITEQAVRMLMELQGTLQPHQIISLFSLGGPTLAMPDHANHIHVGFRPLFGENRLLGQQAAAVLQPGQWGDLIGHLRSLDNPAVPARTR